MFCIVYVLKNTINGKVYVGQTWRSLSERFSEGYRHSPHIFNAIKKYGREYFYYDLLTICFTQETADFWEKFFIKKFNSIDSGYNLREGGSNGKLLESTKLKISEAQSGSNGYWYGKQMSLETKEKMSLASSGENNPFYGKNHSEESLDKMRKNHQNKPLMFSEKEINDIKYKNKVLHLTYIDIANELQVSRKTISKVVNDNGPYRKNK